MLHPSRAALALTLGCLLSGAATLHAQPAPAPHPNEEPDPAPTLTEEEPGEEPLIQAETEQEKKNLAVAMAMIGADQPGGWLKRGWRADLSADLGLYQEELALSRAGWVGFSRLRAGITRVQEPIYLTLGLTGELENTSRPALGLQLEWLEMSTFTHLQVGAMRDFDGEVGLMAAAGWQIVGVEWRAYRWDRSPMQLIVKLKLPISWFIYYAVEE